MSEPAGHPVLTLDQARALEERLFGGDEARQWSAMRRAGGAVASALLGDFEEIGGFPPAGQVLVLAGKGHNAGDALLAARAVLDLHPGATALVLFAFGPKALRPLAGRAWRELAQAGRGRVRVIDAPELDGARPALCLDGLFGFQFRPPVPPQAAAVLEKANGLPIRLRAAVDLPSGLGEAPPEGPVFRADFTYATGSVKMPVVDASRASVVGRLRYLDLGFFEAEAPESRLRVLTPAVLAPLRGLRPAVSDKRSYGHLLLLGGSRRYPGAILMAALAALRSGAGLVTAFVPASLAPAFAARAPEAMWVGWPETAQGGLALEGLPLLSGRWERASALAFGPGLGDEPETRALAARLAGESPLPLVIDADGLQPEIVRAGAADRILTPHAGEHRRMFAGDDFHVHPATRDAVVLLKGRLTGITRGDRGWFSPYGGPVLARGGSGDLLTGIVGGLLAQTPGDPVLAACRGAVWHGLAADLFARAHGQTAVRTTQLLDFLGPALSEDYPR